MKTATAIAAAVVLTLTVAFAFLYALWTFWSMVAPFILSRSL